MSLHTYTALGENMLCSLCLRFYKLIYSKSLIMHNSHFIRWFIAFIYQTHFNYTIGWISLKISNLLHCVLYFFIFQLLTQSAEM